MGLVICILFGFSNMINKKKGGKTSLNLFNP